MVNVVNIEGRVKSLLKSTSMKFIIRACFAQIWVFIVSKVNGGIYNGM